MTKGTTYYGVICGTEVRSVRVYQSIEDAITDAEEADYEDDAEVTEFITGETSQYEKRFVKVPSRKKGKKS